MSFTTYGVDLESALSATRLNLPLDLHYPPPLKNIDKYKVV